MTELREHAGDGGLGQIRALAYAMEPPAPGERSSILRSEAALLLVGLLTRCARGIGAIDVAIGEGLASLSVGDRLAQLGYAKHGDYSRERLDMAPGTARKKVQLAKGLRDRPKLRDAVWLGIVSARKAEVVLSVARGDAEEEWVARAQKGTVRALASAVRAAGGAVPEEDEPWDAVYLDIPRDLKPLAQRAFAAAGKIIGPTAPAWERLEGILQEFNAAFARNGDDEAGEPLLHAPVPDLEQLKADLEELTQEWAFFDRPPAVAAPVPSEPVESDPWLLDAELRRLVRLRREWGDVFAHLAMIFRMLGLWRDAGFASFAHCCDELFGMGVRAVEQRIALARRLYALPALRQAMREGRVSYEKARLIAWKATDVTVDDLIRRAERTTCIALRRELEGEETAQMCTRRGMDIRMPRRIRILLGIAIAAARAVTGKRIPESECLRMLFQHFVDTWEPVLKQRNTLQRRVLARDRGYCQVPICSLAAAQGHHIDYRSAGGSDEPENLVSLCAGHHLHGVHMGYVRVRGKAPDRLHWQLGVRPGMPPLEEFRPTAWRDSRVNGPSG
jgi:hypothetical protein